MREKSSNVYGATFLNRQFSSEDWYIDSGGTTHTTVLENTIEDMTQTNIKKIVIADNTKVLVKCMGNIKIHTKTGKQRHDILVLCIPEIITNLTLSLITVSQLIKNDNKIIFVPDGCKI